MDRKEFIKTSCLLCGGLAGITALIESCKKTDTSPQGPSVNFTIDLSSSSNAALNTVGGYIYQSGVIVACSAANTYIAVAQACTHQGCNVQYATSGKFNCPCHGGVFDSSGNVVSGPPPSPLKKYTVTKSGNIITVAG